jgi:REP element-mobilizing transposase RayT
MGLPRSQYVHDGQEGVYHCFSRCVRRAFLCGSDPHTGRDFSHRKAWIVDRLRLLSAVFAIEVIAYAIMENHYHLILRTRPDLVLLWSDYEVASRWLTLFPLLRMPRGPALPPLQEQISALASCPDRIAVLRRRLSSLSWFMGRLNEHIARRANNEDEVKGRFWESRFKCQALLDEAAVTAAMVYVDLNPIRARLAATPEESDFTSIQERIRSWLLETTSTAAVPGEIDEESALAEQCAPLSEPLLGTEPPPTFLCPIPSDAQRRGILGMTTTEYFDLVDRSGRLVRQNQRGAMDPHLEPILMRIGANSKEWLDTVSRFGSKFQLAAGFMDHLRSFAGLVGRRWLKGMGAARMAFGSPPCR